MQQHDDNRAQSIKLAAQRQWDHDPAGALAASDKELGSPQSFARVERYRYDEQPWMRDMFHFESFAGQRVLEIGVGLGTDHVQFARAGAELTGIDLTPRSIELTGLRLQQEGLLSRLAVMDAERLEFDDDSFDVVYSFGVLHHTASPERAFSEVRRVLRPGGTFIGALYNRRSLFVLSLRYLRLIDAGWRGMSFTEQLSRVEHSTAEDHAAPHVRLFTARELRRQLTDAGFRDVRIDKRHFGLKLRRRPPSWVEDLSARTIGWYLIHHAR
jgi:ubiquinone/menaquinone biosynthesis C-methylase UbiE